MKRIILSIIVLITFSSPVALSLDFSNIDIAKINIERVKTEAQGGEAQSQYIMGYCFLTGTYVSPDMSKAIEWFCKSSDQEYREAMVVMGEFYYLGVDGYVEQDKRKAKELFKEAASKGSKVAQTWLRNIRREDETGKCPVY